MNAKHKEEKVVMLIQTLSGELFSIPYSEGESLDHVKKRIQEIEPTYEPFGQCLVRLSPEQKPLRPLRTDDHLGLVQEHVAVRFIRPTIIAYVDEPREGEFPAPSSIRGFYFMFYVRYHRKRAPRTFYKKAFVYDPDTGRFAAPGEFTYMYHQFEPFRTFVVQRWMTDIEWHSSLRSIMEWLHRRRDFPFSEAIFEVAARSWKHRQAEMEMYWREEIDLYYNEMMKECERREQFPVVSEPPLFDYEYDL